MCLFLSLRMPASTTTAFSLFSRRTSVLHLVWMTLLGNMMAGLIKAAPSLLRCSGRAHRRPQVLQAPRMLLHLRSFPTVATLGRIRISGCEGRRLQRAMLPCKLVLVEAMGNVFLRSCETWSHTQLWLRGWVMVSLCFWDGSRTVQVKSHQRLTASGQVLCCRCFRRTEPSD